MIETALIVFFVAALIGVFLLRYIFRDMPAPKGVALVHGLAGGTGLVLVVIYAIFYSAGVVISLILLIIAAAGGLLMFSADMLARRIPRAVPLLHALFAIPGVAFLIAYFLQ